MWIMIRSLLVTFMAIVWLIAGNPRFDHLQHHADPHKHHHNVSHESNYNATYFSQYYEYRGMAFNRDYENDKERDGKMLREFRKHSKCPAMQFGASCAGHNPVRQFMLIKEASTFDVTQTKSGSNISIDINHVDPILLLQQLKNRRLLFFGDSTMVQTYASLVCHLHNYASLEYQLTWMYEGRWVPWYHEDNGKCPYHLSCYLLGGEVVIKEYNIDISYRQLNNFGGQGKLAMTKAIEANRLKGRKDFMFVNFGLHYNDYKEYSNDIARFNAELAEIKASSPQPPSIYFIETFPQHFPLGGPGGAGAGGGYFDPAKLGKYIQLMVDHRRNHSNHLLCTPYPSESRPQESDWRNMKVHEAVEERAIIVNISRDMYPYYYSHIDYGDSLRLDGNISDCTHYCYGSAPLAIVISHVLSVLIPQGVAPMTAPDSHTAPSVNATV